MEILVLVGLALLSYGWYDGLRALEKAVYEGKQACQNAQVQFLDGTVQLRRKSFRRDPGGHLKFLREFQFEFATDGAYRYRGSVKLLGQAVIEVYMPPYRELD